MAVTHLGEHLGTLSVWTRTGQPLNGTGRRLLGDLAVPAGLVLHTARLTAELGRRIDELRSSRQRLVATQDAERRRLERDMESQGLTAALTAHARRLPLRVDVVGGPQRFTRGIETAVYFCCVEALQNTIKHAGADRASVRLCCADGRLHVSVRDNGHGFDPRASRPGMGLQNLTDRVEALNATLHVTSGDTGTTITTDIPAQPV